MGTLATSVFSRSSFVSPVFRFLFPAKTRNESVEELHWASQIKEQQPFVDRIDNSQLDRLKARLENIRFERKARIRSTQL